MTLLICEFWREVTIPQTTFLVAVTPNSSRPLLLLTANDKVRISMKTTYILLNGISVTTTDTIEI
jgi:hypothetical protein